MENEYKKFYKKNSRKWLLYYNDKIKRNNFTYLLNRQYFELKHLKLIKRKKSIACEII